MNIITTTNNQPPPPPPPIPSSSSHPPWTCSVCTSELLSPPHSISHNLICKLCITRLFELALIDETAWPPRWGALLLHHGEFRDVLDADLLMRLDERVRERRCPVAERVYCRQQQVLSPGRRMRRGVECGAFLGRRWGVDEDDESKCQWCGRCGLCTCLRCLRRFEFVLEHGVDVYRPGGEGEEERRIRHHLCVPPEEDNAAKRQVDAAFQGLHRGRDYQDCPNCRQRVQLADGCNHITCTCGVQFCYLCGMLAMEGGSHWDRQRGGCPRYGRPGDEQAMYTEEIAFAGHEDGDEESSESPDEENEDFARWAVPRMLDVQERRAFQRRRQHEELREHVRHHTRGLEQNRDGERRRRGAVDHGQPLPVQHHHVREDEWPDNIPPRDHWHVRRAHRAPHTGFRPLNRHDRGWRGLDLAGARQQQAEMDMHHHLRESDRAPARRPGLRGGCSSQPPHTERRMRREREAAAPEPSANEEYAMAIGIESSRRGQERYAIGLRDSRRRRIALRARRRRRDIFVAYDSGYDSMPHSSSDDSETSLRSYRRRHDRASSERRANPQRRRSSSSTLRRTDQRHREEPVPVVVPGSGRTASHSSDSGSEIGEYEHSTFARQYVQGRRVGQEPERGPQHVSLGRRIWQLCRDVGEAILKDQGLLLP